MSKRTGKARKFYKIQIETVPSRWYKFLRYYKTWRRGAIEDNQCTNIYSSIRNKLTRKLGNPLPLRWSRANTFMYVFAQCFRSSSRTFVEDERRNSAKPISLLDLILSNCQKLLLFIVRFARIRYSIDRCWSPEWTNKWKIVAFINFFSVLWIRVIFFCVSRRIVRFIYKLRIREQTSLTDGSESIDRFQKTSLWRKRKFER